MIKGVKIALTAIENADILFLPKKRGAFIVE
jgi:hypothetical protein